MDACTRGSRRGESANHWEMDGDYRRTRNGGRWRSSTVASARIRMTRVKQRTRRSWREAARDSMPCSAVGATMVASMHDWMRTDFTGRHQRVMRPVDGSTTLVGAGKLSIVKAVAKSNEAFPFRVSGGDDIKPFRFGSWDGSAWVYHCLHLLIYWKTRDFRLLYIGKAQVYPCGVNSAN